MFAFLKNRSISTSQTASTLPKGVQISLDELILLRLKARALRLRSRHKVMTLLAGGRLSGFRGRGMEFEETRHYLPGDDVRSIDWRVTARSNKPHTKIFREERERPVIILCDFSPSLYFATRVAFKSVIAAQSAALLAWAAQAQGDRVGGMVLTPQQHQDIRPSGGRRGVLRLLQALAQATVPSQAATTEDTRIAHALQQLRRVTHPGSLICVISDFQGFDAEAEQHLTRLAQHANVLGICVYDELERQLPRPGRYPVTDGTHLLQLNTANAVARADYQQQFDQQQARLQAVFAHRSLRLIPLATHQDVLETLRLGLQGSVPVAA